MSEALKKAKGAQPIPLDHLHWKLTPAQGYRFGPSNLSAA